VHLLVKRNFDVIKMHSTTIKIMIRLFKLPRLASVMTFDRILQYVL